MFITFASPLTLGISMEKLKQIEWHLPLTPPRFLQQIVSSSPSSFLINENQIIKLKYKAKIQSTESILGPLICELATL